MTGAQIVLALYVVRRTEVATRYPACLPSVQLTTTKITVKVTNHDATKIHYSMFAGMG